MTRKRQRQRGSTLTETVTAVFVISAMGGGLFTMMSSSSGMYQTSLRSSAMREKTIRTWSTLRDDLEQADPASVTIDTNDPVGDAITYQVALSANAGVVTWGALQHDGKNWVEYPGAVVRIGPEQRQDGSVDLVREVLTGVGGQPLGREEILARNLDQSGQRGKAFELAVNGNFVGTTMRLGDLRHKYDNGANEIRTSFRVGPYGDTVLTWGPDDDNGSSRGGGY